MVNKSQARGVSTTRIVSDAAGVRAPFVEIEVTLTTSNYQRDSQSRTRGSFSIRRACQTDAERVRCPVSQLSNSRLPSTSTVNAHRVSSQASSSAER